MNSREIRSRRSAGGVYALSAVLEVEPGTPIALSALKSPTAITYLEQIARRPASFRVLRSRAWVSPTHDRVLWTLKRARWISEQGGLVRTEPSTVALVRDHFEDLFVRLGVEVLRIGQSLRTGDERTVGLPVDARLALPLLATPQRWAVFVALTEGPLSNADVADRLEICHSLVSYHVRHLERAALISRNSKSALKINGRAVLEIWELLRLLEIGWPYRPGLTPTSPMMLGGLDGRMATFASHAE